MGPLYIEPIYGFHLMSMDMLAEQDTFCTCEATNRPAESIYTRKVFLKFCELQRSYNRIITSAAYNRQVTIELRFHQVSGIVTRRETFFKQCNNFSSFLDLFVHRILVPFITDIVNNMTFLAASTHCIHRQPACLQNHVLDHPLDMLALNEIWLKPTDTISFISNRQPANQPINKATVTWLI